MDELQRQITFNTSQIQIFKEKKGNLETELIPLRNKLKKTVNKDYPGIKPTTDILETIFKKYPDLAHIQLINKEIVQLNRQITNLTRTNNALRLSLANQQKIENKKTPNPVRVLPTTAKPSVRPEKRLEEALLKPDSSYDVNEEELEEFMKKESSPTKPIEYSYGSSEEKDADELGGPGIIPLPAAVSTKVSDDELGGPESPAAAASTKVSDDELGGPSLALDQRKTQLQDIRRDLLDNKGNKKSLFGDTSKIDENNNELEKKLEEEEIQKNKEQVERRQVEDMQRRQKEEDDRKSLRDVEFRKQLDEYEATKRKKIEAITRKKDEATKRKKLQLNNKTKKNKQKEIQMKQMKGPSEDISTAEFEKLMPTPVPLSVPLSKPVKLPIEAGFRRTLSQTKKIVKPIHTNPNIICKSILKSGKNLTKKKYYLPSQFPNLTKLKPKTEEKPKTEKKPKTEEKPT